MSTPNILFCIRPELSLKTDLMRANRSHEKNDRTGSVTYDAPQVGGDIRNTTNNYPHYPQQLRLSARSNRISTTSIKQELEKTTFQTTEREKLDSYS